MSKPKYHVAPQFLQGGETVLWASYGLEKKKIFGYPYWVTVTIGVLAALYSAYSYSGWLKGIKIFADPRMYSVYVVFGLSMIAVAIILKIAKQKGWVKEGAHSLIPEIQKGYYVAMITDQRIALFGTGLDEGFDLCAGDIEALQYDYSNGGRVIKLELVSGMGLSAVNIESTRDLAVAKQLIEDRFIKGGKMFRALDAAQEALA